MYDLTHLSTADLPLWLQLQLPSWLARIHSGLLNQVEVAYKAKFFFVLKTRWKHALDGIAIHGVFEDADSQFWMFQEGYGSPNTCGKQARHLLYTLAWLPYPLFDHLRDTKVNYLAARRMWRNFAGNIREDFPSSTK